MHPEYAIFQGIETDIDEKWMRLGLKWNVLVVLFYLAKLLQPQEINSKDDNRKEEKSIDKEEESIKVHR